MISGMENPPKKGDESLTDIQIAFQDGSDKSPTDVEIAFQDVEVKPQTPEEDAAQKLFQELMHYGLDGPKTWEESEVAAVERVKSAIETANKSAHERAAEGNRPKFGGFVRNIKMMVDDQIKKVSEDLQPRLKEIQSLCNTFYDINHWARMEDVRNLNLPTNKE
jgi:hypothetical protein